uniref:NADH dehydrogenase subunit 1 n=1 Tax=Heterorhabditis bacteriophora TaxID=37862 RepID=A0A1I7WJY0_HETBA
MPIYIYIYVMYIEVVKLLLFY